MLTIRMSSVGKKKQPSYRILVQEKEKDPWGKFVENIGHYDPLVNPAKLDIKKDRLEYWMQKGAEVSDTLNNILINAKVIEGQKRKVVKLKKQTKEEAAKKEEEKKAEKKPEAPKETPPTTPSTPPAVA